MTFSAIVPGAGALRYLAGEFAFTAHVPRGSTLVEQIILPEVQSPPLPPQRRTELLGRSALGRRFLEVSARTPLELVREEFEHDVVRAGLLFFNGLREIDLRAPGFGHSIAALLAGRHKAKMCLGGSARLAEALVEDIREHGGEIRTGVEPKAILTRLPIPDSIAIQVLILFSRNQ